VGVFGDVVVYLFVGWGVWGVQCGVEVIYDVFVGSFGG